MPPSYESVTSAPPTYDEVCPRSRQSSLSQIESDVTACTMYRPGGLPSYLQHELSGSPDINPTVSPSQVDFHDIRNTTSDYLTDRPPEGAVHSVSVPPRRAPVRRLLSESSLSEATKY